MPIIVPPDCEKRIIEHVELDYFDSPEQVLRAALDALTEVMEREQKLAELRREIDVGIEDADAGRVSPFNEEMVQGILARAQEKVAGKEVEAGL